jgi:hypothetical protein
VNRDFRFPISDCRFRKGSSARGLLWAAVGAALAIGCASCGRPRPADAPPKPRAIRPPKAEAIEAAIGRGMAFLLERQNKDGSWGSARNTKGLNIYAPVPGAHHGFRAAVTSLCLSALIETGGGSPVAQKAIERGEAWLVENLPRVRRAEPAALYNVWGHAYGIEALVRLLGRQQPGDASRRERLVALIREQIGFLERYESVDGGWGYYDFNAHTQKPSGSPTSFTTATGLVALHEAKAAGVPVPEKLVQRAVATVHRQQKPDFTYLYAEPWKFRPMYPINRPGGSLGRSQACNLALRLWGDARITDEVLKTWLDRLFARNGWLDMGRKRPIPHESWFQVAAYFFYYGHYHAALCIEQLRHDERKHFQDHLAYVLLRLQEKDGSWWDFPFYDYHQQYGTAFALMSLARCRRGTPGS